MDSSVRIVAIGTPLLLSLMGLVMALWPPGKRARWFWVAGFLIVGAAACRIALWQQGNADLRQQALQQQIDAQQGQIGRIAIAAGIKAGDPSQTDALTNQIVARLTPTLKTVGQVETTDNQDGSQTSKVTVEVIAPIPPAWLAVQMCGDGILGLDFWPNQSIVAAGQSGQSAQSGNCHIARAQQPSGQWVVEVRTKKGSALPGLNYQFGQ
jgi:hypothetical protein